MPHTKFIPGIPALLIACPIITALLLLPLPALDAELRRPLLFHGIENFGHPVAFALLAMGGQRALHLTFDRIRRMHILWLATALVVFAITTEFLQQFTGRDPAWEDLVADVLGAAAGLLWIARRRLTSIFAAVTFIAATAPLLWILAAYAYRASSAPIIWRPDSVLLDRFATIQLGEYPGLLLQEVPPDWSGFQVLRIAIRNPARKPAVFSVRIHDIHHDQHYIDRFNRDFLLSGELDETVEIPLPEIENAPANRSMDMKSIAQLLVFQHSESATPGFMPTQITLGQQEGQSGSIP